MQDASWPEHLNEPPPKETFGTWRTSGPLDVLFLWSTTGSQATGKREQEQSEVFLGSAPASPRRAQQDEEPETPETNRKRREK